MRRFIGLLISLLLVAGVVGLMYGVDNDSITLKVTCAPALSVSITEDEYNFGSIANAFATVSTYAITVTNDSSGRIEDYVIDSSTYTSPGNWQIVTADPVDEEFALQAMLDTSQPAHGDFVAGDYLDTTNGNEQNMDSTNFAGDQNGDDVSSTAGINTRSLWFRLQTPDSSADTNEQSFTVTITAKDAGTF